MYRSELESNKEKSVERLIACQEQILVQNSIIHKPRIKMSREEGDGGRERESWLFQA